MYVHVELFSLYYPIRAFFRVLGYAMEMCIHQQFATRFCDQSLQEVCLSHIILWCILRMYNIHITLLYIFTDSSFRGDICDCSPSKKVLRYSYTYIQVHTNTQPSIQCVYIQSSRRMG